MEHRTGWHLSSDIQLESLLFHEKDSDETQAFHSEFPLGPMEDIPNNSIVYNFKYQFLKLMYHTQPHKAEGPGWIYSLNDSIILWVPLFFFQSCIFYFACLYCKLLFTGKRILG